MINENNLKESIFRALQEVERQYKRGIPYAKSGVPGYMIKHWEAKGLIPAVGLPKHHREYAVDEYMWLCVVRDLTKLGCSWDSIKKVFAVLMSPRSLTDYRHVMKPSDFDRLFSDHFSPEEKEAQFQKKRKELSHFYICMIGSLAGAGNLFLLVDEHGDHRIDNPASYVNEVFLQDISNFKQRPHLSISLKSLVNELMFGLEPKKYLYPNGWMDFKEAEVFDHIRSGKYQSIQIKTNKSGEIIQFELNEVVQLNEGARVKDFIAKNGYQEITIKTENGKVVHCTNTRKFK
jgi:DNA-binding transcriptional MerR regulator